MMGVITSTSTPPHTPPLFLAHLPQGLNKAWGQARSPCLLIPIAQLAVLIGKPDQMVVAAFLLPPSHSAVNTEYSSSAHQTAGGGGSKSGGGRGVLSTSSAVPGHQLAVFQFTSVLTASSGRQHQIPRREGPPQH